MRKFILIIVAISFFLGCEPLDEVPFSSLSVENLYQSEEDVDGALFGVYGSLNNGNNDIWYFLYTSGPGESVVVRLRGGSQGRSSSLNFIPTDAQGSWWNNFYRGINRANSVMANVSQAGLEPSLEEQKVAEARFLRGFSYYNLVKWFGGVPLQLEETADFSDESIKKPRSSAEEVYNVIIEDLKFAESRLPDSWGSANLGRATSGAAKSLLGKVYLNMAGKPLEKTEMYQLAVDKLREVANSGTYSLQANFEDVFSIDNELNSEIIFARVNIRENFAGNLLTFSGGAPNTPFAFAGQYQFGFTEAFYNSYDENDLRRDVTLLFSYTDINGDLITYNDPNNPPISNPYADPTGIGFGKLRDPLNNISPFAHTNDLLYIRYADVLLMLAEALNQNGNSSEALNYLNQVRNRAGLETVTETGQDALLEIIKQERKWELAGEHTEYPDLQRWGDIEQSLQKNEDAQVFGTVYSPTIELLPIPQSQLDANENLVQNPGY